MILSNRPTLYINALMNAIVGLEIVIDHIDGKWKVSQNRSQADQRGIVAGLGEHPIAHLIADRLA